MNAVTKQLAAPAAVPSALDLFMGQVLPPDKRSVIARSLPAHVPMARFERNLSNVLMQTPKLLKCDPRLVFREVSKIAALGLYCDPALGEAYLIAAWNGKNQRDEPQLRIGYRGLIKLARQSGEIATIYAHEVYANDTIDCELGVDKRLVHKPVLFGERGPVIGYYAVVHFKDGSSDFEPMTMEQIYAIRDRSDGWKAFKANRIKSTPWSTDEEEMAKKTVLRRLCKRIPQSPDLADAWKLEDAAEAPMVDVTPEKPRLTAGEALKQIADEVPQPDAPEDFDQDNGVSDVHEIDGDPAVEASGGEGAPSHPTPAPSSPEAPSLDFGAPPEVAMTEDDASMLARAIVTTLDAVRSPKAVDNYLATDKREEMARLQAQYPELHRWVIGKAADRKRALAK